MGARPITGWAYAPGAGSPWPALHVAFGLPLTSETPLARALEAAARRWGRSRLGTLTVATAWSSDAAAPKLGPGYTLMGPRAHVDALWSAWGLLEENVVDAVLVRTERVELLIERAASAAIQLRRGAIDDVDLTLHSTDAEELTALVVASAAVEGGIACGDAGAEPDRVCVRTPDQAWTVEVRP